MQGVPVSEANAIISKEWKKIKASEKKMKKNTKNFITTRNNNMKRHCKDIKKIIRMKWRSLSFTKSAIRRIGRFYNLKHYPNQMNLKKHHPNQMNLKRYNPNQMNLKKYQGPSRIQARKNRSLKKPIEKRSLQRQEKKHQSQLNLSTQVRSMKKKDHLKMIKSLLCWG